MLKHNSFQDLFEAEELIDFDFQSLKEFPNSTKSAVSNDVHLDAPKDINNDVPVDDDVSIISEDFNYGACNFSQV